MFLQELNGLFHWLNSLKGAVLDLFNITKMSHDFHQKLLIIFGVGSDWKLLDTLVNIFDEVVDVLDLLYSVVEQEASVGVNPSGDSVVKLLDEWVDIHS
jgi:hypothetical protein